MTATKYTKSIANDFPNAKVNTSVLSNEIHASSIVTALDRIDTAADVCDIWFKDAISVGDKTTLDGVVAAHDGESTDISSEKNLARSQLGTGIGTLYTVPAGTVTILRQLNIANTTATNRSVDVHIVDNGGTADDTNKILHQVQVNKKTTLILYGKWVLDTAGDTIQALASAATAITITADGEQIS